MKFKGDTENKYDKLLASIFKAKWKSTLTEVPFSKDEVIAAAAKLNLRIKNLADVIYTYRSRRPMPGDILKTGNWVIAARGSGLYAFVRITGETTVTIPESLKVYPIPYAVPEIVAQNLASARRTRNADDCPIQPNPGCFQRLGLRPPPISHPHTHSRPRPSGD
jgi:hypothetical protein